MRTSIRSKFYFSMFFMIVILLLFNTTKTAAYPVALQPEYAKWGRMAVLETKKRYPNADIIDYLHIGRKQLSPTVAEEQFKLWLREKQNNREFGVFVNIKFNVNTEEVIEMTFRETNR